MGNILNIIGVMTVFCFCCVPPVAAEAHFMGKDNTGARYYKCGASCGKFKVIRVAANVYRVYSIPFSGEMKASSFEDAASRVCNDFDRPLQKITNPIPSRNSPGC